MNIHNKHSIYSRRIRNERLTAAIVIGSASFILVAILLVAGYMRG